MLWPDSFHEIPYSRERKLRSHILVMFCVYLGVCLSCNIEPHCVMVWGYFITGEIAVTGWGFFLSPSSAILLRSWIQLGIISCLERIPFTSILAATLITGSSWRHELCQRTKEKGITAWNSVIRFDIDISLSLICQVEGGEVLGKAQLH